MSDEIKNRLDQLTPEQQKLLKLRLRKQEARQAAMKEAAAAPPRPELRPEQRKMDFSLFFFSADGKGQREGKYRLLTESARYGDQRGFAAVWTPERHFQTFGGLYPNPSVLAAALAMITERMQLRAGSVVLPLHSPIRIAEEWALVDNLSNGRVGISFATGWHRHDYAIRPQHYDDRREYMFKHIETVRQLWRGETVTFDGVDGDPTEVRTLPRPIQSDFPFWVTANSPNTWKRAGAMGANILSMIGTKVEDLAEHIKNYRQARLQNGHDPRTGIVSIMLHTYVHPDLAVVKQRTREPLREYLKNYMKQFAAMGQGDQFGDDESILDFAFERYINHNSLLGTPEQGEIMIDRLIQAGVNDAACLIDFGVEHDHVMESLELLDGIRAKYIP